MSTTRAGDPTATQSPSAPPTPGATPTQTLPADGDACNAASVAQALKVSADFDAWSKSPRAQAAAGTGASNWIEAIQLWKNARLQTRFLVDHLGFPAGKFVHWQEDWAAAYTSFHSGPGLSQPFIGRWLGSIDAAGPSQVIVNYGSNELRSPAYRIEMGTSGAEIRVFTRTIPVKADADTAMVMQWDECVHAGTLNTFEQVGGLVPMSYCTGGVGSAFSATAPNGCAFLRRTGDTNWFVYTKNGGSPAFFDTGVAVAVGTPIRFRIETVGANVGDDSTARAIFYVNGVFKTSVAVGTIADPAPMFETSKVSGGTIQRDIGLIDFRANIWPGSILS